jgi:hypothetical protein
MSSFVGHSIPIALLALIVSCTSFGTQPSLGGELPDGGSGASSTGGASLADASQAIADGGLDATNSACPGAAVLTDGFEGIWSWEGKWANRTQTGSGTLAIDSIRRRTDVNSLRFSTVNYSDTAVLTKDLSGSCPITIRAWIYIGATSVTDGTGLLRLKLTNGGIVGVHLIEGAWIAATNQSPPLGELGRTVWLELVVKYDPANGEVVVSAGNLAPRTFNVGPAIPISVELGILGANDGGMNGDEILFDDVSITR